jgi:hypothetical protein
VPTERETVISSNSLLSGLKQEAGFGFSLVITETRYIPIRIRRQIEGVRTVTLV